MTLFVIYLLLYVGFIVVNAFAPDFTETIVAAGLNLAIVYGFALIFAALVMSIIYGVLCRDEIEDESIAPHNGRSSQ